MRYSVCILYIILFCCFSLHSIEAQIQDKWIVLTTISPPNECIKKLAALEGWNLLVVGDKKSPVDWNLENCIYLGPEDQELLKYKILKVLPWNHYCRKVVGYLYAIENGAKIIYETDDDNFLKDTIKIVSNDELEALLVSPTGAAVNIYHYFGRGDVWPRGFPLEQLNLGSSYLHLPIPDAIKIGIQQGLVDKDPDVDAIFRLTRNEEIYFIYQPPCILGRMSFCPFNTQNTLFHYDAFWGLLIPTTVSFRVCDIWRSYISQRLLWDVGQYICFNYANAYQERNPHILLNDFNGEFFMYTHSGALIEFLLNWRSDTLSLKDRIRELYRTLIIAGFCSDGENRVIDAWIEDLDNLDYKWPEIDKTPLDSL